MLIELPSGLTGEARKIRGSEAIELAERAGTSSGNSLGSILRGCWTRTITPGPYSHAVPDQAGLNWDHVLKGDLLAGMLLLRAGSIPDGKRYDFNVQCESSLCRKRYGWTILDITKDLRVRKLSEESATALHSGEPHVTEVADADGKFHKLSFDLMLPEQDATLKMLLKQLGRKRATPVESLSTQTRTIDGEARSPAAMQRFFKELDLGELNRMRDVYDAADCGVDIDVLTTCQESDCGWEQETTLPFGRTFWRPEAKKAPEGETQV